MSSVIRYPSLRRDGSLHWGSLRSDSSIDTAVSVEVVGVVRRRLKSHKPTSPARYRLRLGLSCGRLLHSGKPTRQVAPRRTFETKEAGAEARQERYRDRQRG